MHESAPLRSPTCWICPGIVLPNQSVQTSRRATDEKSYNAPASVGNMITHVTASKFVPILETQQTKIENDFPKLPALSVSKIENDFPKLPALNVSTWLAFEPTSHSHAVPCTQVPCNLTHTMCELNVNEVNSTPCVDIWFDFEAAHSMLNFYCFFRGPNAPSLRALDLHILHIQVESKSFAPK